MACILAYTTPAAGHVFPLVPGLLELQRRGHHVHLRVGEELLGVARDAGLDASPADPAMGIVAKAVAAGLPIAAVPFGRDQPEVARRVVEAGAGVQLPARKLTPRAAARDRPRGARHEALGGGRGGPPGRRRGGARFADAAEELVSDRIEVASV
jgi:hypothetical protein